jgi:hypothetical protein
MERKLAAIMFTDMVGFSRQMGSNEAHTLRLLTIHNQVIEQSVAMSKPLLRWNEPLPLVPTMRSTTQYRLLS